MAFNWQWGTSLSVWVYGMQDNHNYHLCYVRKRSSPDHSVECQYQALSNTESRRRYLARDHIDQGGRLVLSFRQTSHTLTDFRTLHATGGYIRDPLD
jgi:hypothetical protein